jgi:DNA invertase Pin-like site-specific DNA recombinase
MPQTKRAGFGRSVTRNTGPDKVNFVSLRDGIDLATPAGRLIANVLASVAAYETEVRGERIAAGKATKAAKAARIEAIVKAGGRPPGVNKGGRPKGIPCGS